MNRSDFVHLHVHSHYSLLDGLPRVDQLVARVKELGMPAVALTDHGVLYGAVEFYKTATEAGIKPIIGVEAYVAPHGMHLKRPGVDNRRYHLPLLAETTEGYQNLLALVTKSHLEGFYYKPRIDKDVLRAHAKGLIGLSGCFSGEIPRAILRGDERRARELAAEYRDIFGRDNFYIELQRHPNESNTDTVNTGLLAIARELALPLVATNDVHYLRPDDREAQDIMVCIQTGKTVDDKDRISLMWDDFSLLPADVMRERFADVPEATANTLAIAERCRAKLPLRQPALPSFPVPDGATPMAYLQRLCEQNISRRYADADGTLLERVRDRLRYELSVIEKTGFAPYFLIVQDFVNWAKSKKIAVGPGRGSAAGSIVSYLLNITDIEPLRYDLLFERFLDPNRNQMPDIDIDFADTRRDEVISYVRGRYGHDKVAQIVTFGTLGARAAVRDVGRALGLPYGFCDQMAKMIPFGLALNEALEKSDDLRKFCDADPQAQRLIDMAKKLEGSARHTSTHAAGVVITPESLVRYLPLQYAAQDDRSVITQYEMYSVEDLGLLKMDFLGLKNLTIIERALKIIERTRKRHIVISAIPLNDRIAFELLQKGETTGVFQLESTGMRRYLKRLKPTEFGDIVAMVALYRPGPLGMGMVDEYIERKHGRKDIEYLHPKLQPILEKTYGVMVYQEQLLQLARDLGGFSISEADVLRKAVGKKIKELLDEQRDKLIRGMTANGIEETTASRIWDFIEPFAQYGFNLAHSVSYATIAYQTAYLKANFFPEFMTALMASEKNDLEEIATLVEECRRNNLAVLPPHINESMEDFTHVIEREEPAIRFGLGAIKNLGGNVVRAIDAERSRGGPFTSFGNFVQRLAGTDVNRKSLESLIKAGALDAFGDRAELLASVEWVLSAMRKESRVRRSGQTSLFGGTDGAALDANARASTGKTATKSSPKPTIEDRALYLRWERELLGLYLTGHPIDSAAKLLKRSKATPIGCLLKQKRGTAVTVAGIIAGITRITTKHGDPMLFVTLEDRSGRIEAIVFPRVLKDNARAIREDAIVVVRGKLAERDDRLNLLCETITPIERYVAERETDQKTVTLAIPFERAETLLPVLQAALASLPRGPYGVTVKLVGQDATERRIETRHAVASPQSLERRLREFDEQGLVTVET